MASRITIYGTPSNADTKRLKREMNVMLLEYDLVDPTHDQRGQPQLPDWTPDAALTPMVEIRRSDDQGSVYLKNPDEPTLRQCLYSEGILSVTAYWV
ncbi:MAG: hypothetical protein ACLQVD_09660 [Capsulimonadaceae bacterium]